MQAETGLHRPPAREAGMPVPQVPQMHAGQCAPPGPNTPPTPRRGGALSGTGRPNTRPPQKQAAAHAPGRRIASSPGRGQQSQHQCSRQGPAGTSALPELPRSLEACSANATPLHHLALPQTHEWHSPIGAEALNTSRHPPPVFLLLNTASDAMRCDAQPPSGRRRHAPSLALGRATGPQRLPQGGGVRETLPPSAAAHPLTQPRGRRQPQGLLPARPARPARPQPRILSTKVMASARVRPPASALACP
jgi:hypothetical protein